MAPSRKKATTKRASTKRSTSAATKSKSRYTDAQICDALDALATGNLANAQRALGLMHDISGEDGGA